MNRYGQACNSIIETDVGASIPIGSTLRIVCTACTPRTCRAMLHSVCVIKNVTINEMP